MQQLLTALQIIFGLFALFGIYEYIRYVVDCIVMKKAKTKCKVYICSCSDDIEYAVRFAESRFILGDYSDFFDGVVISEAAGVDTEIITKLNKEFGNIHLA